jgi:hypothetical protein
MQSTHYYRRRDVGPVRSIMRGDSMYVSETQIAPAARAVPEVLRASGGGPGRL